MRALKVTAIIVLTFLTTGCELVNSISGQRTFEEEQAWALALRGEFEAEIPKSAILKEEDHDVLDPCGNGTTAFEGIRYFFMKDDEFDRVAWLDSIVERYEARDDWAVERKVRVDDPSETTAGVTLFGAGERSVSVNESYAKDKTPILVISVGTDCGIGEPYIDQ
ncbi:hypothetical protein [Lysinibacter cavernae]|uniref:Uncharacterized protein n=1 Tax=Lysinibacter cavernae TaxID=1640652 RepID=A0A7X5TTX4_9MICO|nr:hypothetical protein [Lysinibacter cavernae]NIH53979.1 hypothetical protein [Lysinibacter cavernae]